MFDGNFMRRMHVIAHRGASAYAPENTLAAFELAVRQGAGCLEHDLQVTRDGVARLADRERIASIAAFASGIGPAKALIAAQPDIVDLAHAVGMRVTPWTFRAGATAPFDSVAAETHHHLDALGVDAVITDHPELVQP